MQKLFLLTGTVLGGLSVMIGAFGAHALRTTLAASGRADTFETAVKYQFYHALALILLGVFLFRMEGVPMASPKLLPYAGYCFIAGVVIFSGSLYILCLTNVTKWGAVTPIGGLFLIVGWALWAWAIFAMNNEQ
ncbi:MAG: DUF423 domain-containing protein [Bacteroidota bacterium]